MKVLIVDDHSVVRKGLAQILKDEFADIVIEQAGDSISALPLLRKQVWDLVLLDISMPGRNGIELLKQLRAEGMKMPVLMLSMHPESQYAVRVLKAGANGFLSKDSATDELLLAVKKVLSGKKYITDAVAEQLAESFDHDPEKNPHENLSDRELQVMILIASGKTVSEVAEELSLTISTISTYRVRVLEKMNMHNNSELTRYAFENGLM